MRLDKMYINAKTKEMILSMFCSYSFLFVFVIDDYESIGHIERILLKVLLTILLLIGIIDIIYILYRKSVLRKSIKSNKVKTLEVIIKDVQDISILTGYRSENRRDYFGIKIKTKYRTYLLLYKDIHTEKSDFSLYYKLERYKNKKIKIQVYERTNVIKKILTNI